MDSARTTADRKPCFGMRLCAELRRLVVLAIIGGLIVIAAKYYGFDRLNEEIRARVESQLRENYRTLTVSVRSARRVAGRGVEIRGIRIAHGEGRAARVLAEIEEVFAECDTRLPDFLTKPLEVTGLRVRRLKLRAERNPGGDWNLAYLLPLPNCQSASAPRATVTDSTLELMDASQTGGRPAGGLVLRNIELTVAPETASAGSSPTVLHIRGTLAGDHVERVELDGMLNPTTCAWELRGSVEGLEFSPRLRAAVPRELSGSLAPLSSIRGRTFFGFHVSRGPRLQNGAHPPLDFAIQGKIADGRIDDARLPEPLTDVEARIRCDNAGVRVEDLSARCGAAQIELTASLAGYTGRQSAHLQVTARAVSLERWPRSALPPTIREAWDQFQPRGLADITGHLRFDGGEWRPDVKIEYRDLSICYQRFPYRLTDGSGTIALKSDSLHANLQLLGGGRLIHCRGEIRNPGPQYAGWIQIESDGPVAIDEKVISAMEAPTQQLLRPFQPRGSASFVVRLERSREMAPTHRRVEIKLHECSIRHDRFPYPIDRVSGRLVGDDDNWEFRELTGRNDSAEITAEGFWKQVAANDRRLALRFTAGNVPLADELRLALSSSAQGLWSNLRPRGNVDSVVVDLGYSSAAQAWSLDVEGQKNAPGAASPAASASEGPSISLEPAWFRYPLNQVSGKLRYRNGQIELSNLRAAHGHMNVSANARCTILSDGGYRLDLNDIAADGLEVDQELLAALPGGVGQSLGRHPLQGLVSARGRVTLAATPQASAQAQISWDLELDVENGRLLAALPIEHIHGGLSLRGQHGAEGLFARGELNIDSAMIRGVQLVRLQGPYWCDGKQLVVGAFADRDNPRGAPRQITARLVGGLLSLDGMLLLGGDGNFDVQVTLANADLPEIARELAPHQSRPAGKVFGLAHILGSSQGKHTWHGDGKINLREADLYELPAMITLLKLLSVQRPDSTAFTNSNIDFRIEGDDIVFDRIDFSGDAISLKGKGRMNGQRQIDLKFYPLVGREERQLAIFRPLIGQTGQELMLIEVTGTIDQPDIRRTPFPRLDARLQQLFPELVRNELVEPKTPPTWTPREAINRLRPATWR